MNWITWANKLWKGAIVAGALAILGYLYAAADVAAHDANAAPYVALAMPIIMLLIQQLQNAIKHWNDPKTN